jgi:hypothetical protein
MNAGERAAMEMRRESDLLTKSLQEQIGTIDTLSDKLSTMGNVSTQIAKDYSDLQALLKQGTIMGTLLGTNPYATPEQINEKVREIQEHQKLFGQASAAPTAETEEERRQRQSQFRRERIEREAGYEARMSYYGTAGQLATRQRKIGQVQGEVNQGKALIDERARIAKEENDDLLKIKKLQGVIEIGKAAGEDVSQFEAQVSALRAGVTQRRQGSSSASIKSAGNIDAINAALKAEALKNQGDTSSSAYKEAIQTAGGYLGKSREDLIRERDQQRSKQDQAKEIEDNYENNVGRLSQLKHEQVAQILSNNNPVVSSLARIGGGGNTGDSDIISIARTQKDLTKEILEILRKGAKITDPSNDSDLFGTY